MQTRTELWLPMMLVLLLSGCDNSSRIELERTHAELQKTRTELAQLQTRQVAIEQQLAVQSYLDELEKLDTLKALLFTHIA